MADAFENRSRPSSRASESARSREGVRALVVGPLSSLLLRCVSALVSVIDRALKSGQRVRARETEKRGGFSFFRFKTASTAKHTDLCLRSRRGTRGSDGGRPRPEEGRDGALPRRGRPALAHPRRDVGEKEWTRDWSFEVRELEKKFDGSRKLNVSFHFFFGFFLGTPHLPIPRLPLPQPRFFSMCLAPPKAAPAAFLDEASGGLRRRGKATLAAARDAAVAVASAPSADAQPCFDVPGVAETPQQPAAPEEPAPSLFNDLLCLKTMWFQKQTGSTHEERLSSFYAPQAEACEFFVCDSAEQKGTLMTTSAPPSISALPEPSHARANYASNLIDSILFYLWIERGRDESKESGT